MRNFHCVAKSGGAGKKVATAAIFISFLQLLDLKSLSIPPSSATCGLPSDLPQSGGIQTLSQSVSQSVSPYGQ